MNIAGSYAAWLPECILVGTQADGRYMIIGMIAVIFVLLILLGRQYLRFHKYK